MKILTWNINGLRSLKTKVKNLLIELEADIVCFQETKISTELHRGGQKFFFRISTQSFQGIKLVKLVNGVCWGCVFFFLISTQSYQGIKLVELVDELVDCVCWGCVFFFLISTQSYKGIKLVELVNGVCTGDMSSSFLSPLNHIRGIKLVELVNGVCWGCVFFFLISTQSYQGIKLVELVDGCQLEESQAIVPGHTAYFNFPRHRQGYSGVATYVTDHSRPVDAEEGLASSFQPDFLTPRELTTLDSEGRAVITFHQLKNKKQLAVINLYCPRADPDLPERLQFKLDFYRLLRWRVEQLLESGCEVLALGDFNTAHRPVDHCDPCSPEEFDSTPSRQWMKKFVQNSENPDEDTHARGHLFTKDSFHWKNDHFYSSKKEKGIDCIDGAGLLVDLFRHFHPDQKEAYTCWNVLRGSRATNYGTRIDYILGSPGLLPYCESCEILPEVMGSDHCPVRLTLAPCIEPLSCPPPALATHHWPEFSGGRQTSLQTFLVTKSSQESLENPPKKKPRKDASVTQTSIRNFFTKNTTVEPKPEPIITKSTSTESQMAWKSLLRGPAKAPLCSGHSERCLLRTVQKEGVNKGRQFYICPRPKGPPNNPLSQCNYFSWLSSKSK
ncbi:APEX2 [Cordylochernes scorpioides]|uniref:DNA-(apurinic or apyrimidinic site) endonuclease 2 n=1 Tax=Cordylochernes scorpioides TaxID=51811 RepID=A0ABY6JWY3_9ARAC|nr:APEX2 [Cordylochernes scorpioides]